VGIAGALSVELRPSEMRWPTIDAEIAENAE